MRSRTKTRKKISKLRKTQNKTQNKTKIKTKIITRKGGRPKADLYEEAILLKTNMLKLFKVITDMAIKYYPDLDVPNRNILVALIVKYAYFIKNIVCDTTGKARRMFCGETTGETPQNLKELLCNSSSKMMELNCKYVNNIIDNIDKLLSSHLLNLIKFGNPTPGTPATPGTPGTPATPAPGTPATPGTPGTPAPATPAAATPTTATPTTATPTPPIKPQDQ